MTILYLKMARTHARVKGKSGSKRPVNVNLSFVTMKPQEVEKLIVKFAKDEDKRSSEIGLILRDTYGIPSVKVLTGKSISQILEEAKVKFSLPEDLQALIKKAAALKKHLENNSRDVHNKRGLQLIESKIRRLSTYYKKTGKLSATWRFN